MVELGGEVSSAASHLTFRLAVSEECLNRVLGFIVSEETLDWNKIFNLPTPYESVYGLFIASAILADSSDPNLLKVRVEPQSEERKIWKEMFFRKGGVEWAISVLSYTIINRH